MKDDQKDSFLVEEDFVKYNEQKDFTTLEAWKKARLVKLFFYTEVIPLLPIDEELNLNLSIP